MGTTFSDVDVAAKFRDIIREMVADQIKDMRPEVRVAQVLGIDNDNLTAQVQFAGDEGFVNARFGKSLQPRDTNAIVRVAGRVGNYYITEILNDSGAHTTYEPIATDYAAGDLNNSLLDIGGGNLVANSSFADTTALPIGFGTVNVTSETTTVFFGSKALRVTSNNASQPFGIGATIYPSEDINVRLKPNTEYVASVWYYIPGGSAITQANVWITGTGVTVASTQAVTTQGQWLRAWSKFTTGASGTFKFDTTTNVDPAVGQYIIIGAVQLEMGNTPTAYAPRPDEILPGTITGVKIADDSITAAKLVAGSVVAGKIAAGAIDGMTITGATIQTTSTALRGVKITTTGIKAYDGSGNQTFSVDAATGAVDISGRFVAGSTAGEGIELNSYFAKFYFWGSQTGQIASTVYGVEITSSPGTGSPNSLFLGYPGIILDYTTGTGEIGIGWQMAITPDTPQGKANIINIGNPASQTKIRGTMDFSHSSAAITGLGRTINRIDFGYKSGTVGSASRCAVNHNLGAVPTAVVAINAGDLGRTTTADPANFTASQFEVSVRSADGTTLSTGAAVDFFWIAIR